MTLEHHATVRQYVWRRFRARCDCGWRSRKVTLRWVAAMRAWDHEHMLRVRTRHARDACRVRTRNMARYRDRRSDSRRRPARKPRARHALGARRAVRKVAGRMTLMDAPRALDLFCGDGGVSEGLRRAGFTVTGVDIKPHPRYQSGEFVQADAIEYAKEHAHEYDVIFGSPPCKRHTTMKHFSAPHHLDLVADTRAVMVASGRPYVIENVPGAPLNDPVVLCGTMFGLGVMCRDGRYRQLWRHRLFESNMSIATPGPCRHHGSPISVYGTGGDRAATNPRTDGGGGNPYRGNIAERRAAMGIDWMTAKTLDEAIPPAYAEHIGRQLIEVCT